MEPRSPALQADALLFELSLEAPPGTKPLIRWSQVATQSFEDRGLLCPPLPGNAVKLLFSTSPKTLVFEI